MAEPQKYRISYTLPEYDGTSAARELPNSDNLPKERPRVRTKTVKAKVVVAPFAIVGIAAALMLLLMVIMGYVRLYEAESAKGELEDQLTAASQENSRLRSQYESLLDYDQIDNYATSHGMQKPTSWQTVYVNVPHPDVGQIRIAEESNIFEKAWAALCDSFDELMEYLQ